MKTHTNTQRNAPLIEKESQRASVCEKRCQRERSHTQTRAHKYKDTHFDGKRKPEGVYVREEMPKREITQIQTRTFDRKGKPEGVGVREEMPE